MSFANRMSHALAVVLSVITFGFQAFADIPTRPDEDNLTHDFAIFRKSQIDSVSYDLSFRFKKTSDKFEGRTVIHANLNRTDAPLSIDLNADQIKNIRVNGQYVADYISKAGSFEIPAKYLSSTIQLDIEYVGASGPVGSGFQKFTDPDDHAEYFFTDFEPYQAHALFPCFDQPDLKAQYRIQVAVPKDWKAISNSLVEGVVSDGENQLVQFSQSPPLSTYLVFLGVGPYASWTDHWNYKGTSIPLEIYSRKSLAQYIDADQIFDISKKGLTFFSDYFSYEYPFPKYGYVFAPELGPTGMENPGAITLNESQIFRNKPSSSDFNSRSNVMLHEMAHHWFGDLVTLQWWNDIWLNESFATYLAFLAETRALGVQSAWIDFNGMKNWGYWQDSLITTHPIESPVMDVQSGMANFDGITYAKGGAALKQLHFLVGDDSFRAGLSQYFKKFSFKNSTRQNFTDSVSDAAKTDLTAWNSAWLQTAGPNHVFTKWDCANGKLSRFDVIQEKNASGALSPHKTRIVLFYGNDTGRLNADKSVDVAYSEETNSVPELLGQPCPNFIDPNNGDFDYAIFDLDPISLEVVKNRLTSVPDSLSRFMAWESMYQMLRRVSVTWQDYMDFVIRELPLESDRSVISDLLGPKSSILGVYFNILSLEQRNQIGSNFEKAVWSMATAQASNAQEAALDFYLSLARSSEAKDRLRGLIKGDLTIPGITFNQDQRWKAIQSLVRTGMADSLDMLLVETKRDSSSRGQIAAFAAQISVPTLENKMKYWDELQNNKSIPRSWIREGMKWFHDPDHPELIQSFVTPFFDKVTTMDWSKHPYSQHLYFDGLFPKLCTNSLLDSSRKAMNSAAHLTPAIKRAWLEVNDELERCIEIRQK